MMSDLRGRRELVRLWALSGFALVSLPISTLGSTLAQILGKPTPEYLSKVLNRYHKWYCQEFFDFEKALSSVERGYLSYCRNHMETWESQLPGDFGLPLVSYRHLVKGAKQNHSGLAMSCSLRGQKFYDLVKQVCEFRGLPIEAYNLPQNLYGLGWDVENELFDIFHWYPQRSLFSGAKDFKLDGEAAGTITNWVLVKAQYSGAKQVSQKAIVGLLKTEERVLKKYPFGPMVQKMWMGKDNQGKVSHYVNLKAFHRNYLNHYGVRIAQRQQGEFIFIADSLSYTNRDEFKLYYP